MSGLILPDELDELGVDVSVPAFVFVKPDGSIGINYVSLLDNALTQPPAYHGLFSYRNVVRGNPIITAPSEPDWMDFIAQDTSNVAHTPTLIWRGIFVFNITSPSLSQWLIFGDPPAYSDRLAVGDNPVSNGVWIEDPDITEIVVPFTGAYRFKANAYVTASAAGAQTFAMGLWYNGAFDAQYAGVGVQAGLEASMSFDIPNTFNAGDRLGLALWNNEPSPNQGFWNVRSIQLLPQAINNIQ